MTVQGKSFDGPLTALPCTHMCIHVCTLVLPYMHNDHPFRKNWESFSQEVSIVEQGNWLHHREQVRSLLKVVQEIGERAGVAQC